MVAAGGCPAPGVDPAPDIARHFNFTHKNNAEVNDNRSQSMPRRNQTLASARRVLALVAFLSMAPATAENVLEEIIVTVRKKAEDLQSVPLSITAFSSDDLQDRGLETLADLAAQTPGLEFVSTGNIAGTRPIIRGLSQQTRVGDEPNVATFIDGIYTPGFSGSTLLFDALERVEVVRGPQSAAYGRNSFAGAINYVSKKPGPDAEFGGRATLGTYDKRALSAYASGPVLGEVLGARLDLAIRDTGGTYKNAVDGAYLANRKTDFVRASLRASFGPLTVDTSATYTKDDITPPARTKIDEYDPRTVGKPGAISPFEQGFTEFRGQPAGTVIGRRRQGEINDVADLFSFDPASASERAGYLYTLLVEWDLGRDFSLVSTSGYQTREVRSLSDVDASPDGTVYLDGIRVPPTEGVIGEPLFVQGITGSQEDRDEISTDLRLNYAGDGRLDWLVGAYFSREDFSDMRVRSGTPALQRTSGACPEELYGPGASRCVVDYAFPDLLVTSETVAENQFLSVYGGFEFDITAAVSLAVEMRQTWEEKSANNTLVNLPSNRLPRGDFGTERYDYFTPRINLSWQLGDDLLAYMLAAKGVKSGGFNGDAVLAEDVPFFPEKNWTYEIGGKFTFWDRRARFNLAAYYIDWDNQQITLTQEDSNSPIVGNIAASTVKGIEAEISLAPTEALAINVGYSYNDAQYDDAIFRTSSGWVDCEAIGTIECIPEVDVNGDPTGRLVSSGRGDGNQLVNTSKHLFNAGAEFHQLIGFGDWRIFVRGDYAYRSKRYVDELNIGWVPALSTVNLRMGLREDRWTVEGFCENLLDDDTPITAFPPRDFLGVPHLFITNRAGRICGVTVGLRYR